MKKPVGNIKRTKVLSGRKMDLHKFAPCKYVAKNVKATSKYGTKMVNARFAYQTTGSLNIGKCGICHLCNRFTPQFL